MFVLLLKQATKKEKEKSEIIANKEALKQQENTSKHDSNSNTIKKLYIRVFKVFTHQKCPFYSSEYFGIQDMIKNQNYE